MSRKNIFENFLPIGKVNMDPDDYGNDDSSAEQNSKTEGAMEDEGAQTQSFNLFKLFTGLLCLILIFRLLGLQIAQGQEHQFMAKGNSIRSRRLLAPRGIVYDQNGEIIAKNIASFALSIFPADLPEDKNSRIKIYRKLQEIATIKGEIFKKIEEQNLMANEEIVIKEGISREESILLEIQILNMPGVAIMKKPIRDYSKEANLAHVLGYIGKISQEELANHLSYPVNSEIGKDGIERTYEGYIKGTDGEERVEVDSRGYFQRRLSTIEPVSGNNLNLYIKLELQKQIDYQLKEKLKELGLNKGTVVALDPRTGGVLAMVNSPSYDGNLFSHGIGTEEYKSLLEDRDKPLLNRAASGIYPSGSIIKPMIAATALEEKIISERTTIIDPGNIQIGEWSFPDWKNHGLVDVKKAIAESCNIFFYSIGGGYDKISGLGINRLKQYLNLFGFGSKTGIDLPSEAAGLIPDPEWKKRYKNESWYIGDTYHLSIGQGDFLVSPLQIAQAIAAIANGGRLLKPQIVNKIISPSGETLVENNPQETRAGFIDPYNLKVVREGMRQAVTSGSARLLDDLPVPSAGKTGTAQFGNEDKTHSWFVSFAPYENPEIVLVVLVEGAGGGHEVALPIAKNILKWYFENK